MALNKWKMNKNRFESSLDGGDVMFEKTRNPDNFKLNRCIAFLVVAVILITLPVTLKASGTTYYFSTSGVDTNDGLSAASPKKTLDAAANLMLPGNTILFKRGDAWYNPNYQLNLSNKIGTSVNPILIDAYGTGSKPIIADMERFVGTDGWTEDPAGSHIWKHAINTAKYTDAGNCYVNYNLPYADGQSKLKVSGTAPTSTQFSISAGYVYVYSTSAPTFVEVTPSDGKALIAATNVSYVTIKNIDLRGGGYWIAISITSPSDHFVLDSCILKEFHDYGIRFEESDNTAQYHNVPKITNCYINKVWSTVQNDPVKSPPGDGISFERAIEAGIISGNTIIDLGHGALRIAGTSPSYHGVKNCIIELNEIYAVNVNYMHPIDVLGVEGKCSYNVVRRNYFHDFKVAGSMLGDHNKIYSNVYVNADVSPTKTKKGSAFAMSPWQINGVIYINHDNIFANNTIYDCEENPIYVNQYSPGVHGTGNIIKNNLIVKWNDKDHSGNLNYGIIIYPPVTNFPTISNNGFWKTSVSDKIFKQNTTTYTAGELNELSYADNNVEQAPLFVDEANMDFRLTSNSPYITGGQVLTGIGSGFVDFDGNAWDPKSPSIGAFQYTDIQDYKKMK